MDIKEAASVVAIITGILTLLGVGGWFAWHLKPKVQKDIDDLTRQKMVQEVGNLVTTANQAAITALTSNLATFVAQNKVLEAETKTAQADIAALKTQVENQQVEIEDIRHDLDALQWSVKQEPQETVTRIEERARARRVARLGKTDD